MHQNAQLSVWKWLEYSLTFLILFFAISVSLSYTLGFFWRNSLFIALLSFTGSIGLLYSKKVLPIPVAPIALVAGLLMMSLASYQVIGIESHVPLSNDALHSTQVRLLEGTIPATYAPYSDISLSYLIGFHLFVRMVMDLIPILSVYHWLWLIGLLFVGFIPIVLYAWVKQLFNPLMATVAALLVVTSKIFYENFLFGLYPWIAATVLMLAALYFITKKEALGPLLVGVIALVHPGSLFNLLILLLVWLVLDHSIWNTLRYGFLMVPLIIGAFIQSYWVSIIPFLTGSTIPSAGGSLLNAILPLPLWLGYLPILLLVPTLYYILKNKEKLTLPIKVLLISFIISILLYILFYWKGSVLFGKLLELYTICAIVLIAFFICELKTSLMFPTIDRRITVIILFIAVLSFFSSGFLQFLVHGSKITPSEYSFAQAFESYDPSLSTVLFLTPHGGKMAEYANKIPYNVRTAYFVSYEAQQVINDDGFFESLEREAKQKQILDKKCITCIDELTVDYVVVDTFFTTIRLPYPIVIQKDSLILYKKP